MEKDELKINEDALARRATRKPSPKENKVHLVSKYCKGCGLCIDRCPTGTLQLVDAPGSKWGVKAAVDAQQFCIGCKMCEQSCPDYAIFVNIDETKKDGAV